MEFMWMFLAPMQVNEADRVLDRFARFMQRSRSIEADILMKSNLIPGEGRGHIILSKPNLTSFSFTWGTQQYAFVQSERRSVEIDRARKRYRQYGSFPAWAEPPGEVNEWAKALFPDPLITGDLRRYSGGAPFSMVKPTPGARSQAVSTTFDTADGRVTLLARIDELGRPLQMKLTRSMGQQSFVVDTHFSKWAVDRTFPPSTFAGSLGRGYFAEALPFESIPIGVGGTFPMGGWTAPGGKSTLGTIVGSRRILVVLMAADCPPSSRLVDFLRRRQPEIKAAGVEIGVIQASAGRLGRVPFPVATNPDGKLIRQIGMPGTPAMYLLEPTGEVRKVWFGYDPKQDRAFLGELKEGLEAGR